ncbi:EF-hand calcium-binding domain protein [Treponema primitia ZAS-2]|uniref:EF-hand calcium-binding domain protein n=1 Tax=Treponema primitia (strain ATCC BAA-887 / DSM 12427 / ZAS-2) TaxID=545694 RepID=F5YMG9_TREPZ|nr:EF-hand calcium-binding domain protein [Treponema primitia ZAS-2]
MNYDDFLKIMKSKNIFLQIIIDDVKYECIPSGSFFMLQSEFQNNYFTIETILK